MTDLDKITTKLGEHYWNWKEEERQKNKAREEFFRAASEAQEISRTVQEIDASDEEEALRIAQRRFQRHRIVDAVQQEDGRWSVVLEEDPELKEFTWVNKTDGHVYTKSISEASPSLDDDAIAQERPELWESITEEVTIRRLKPLEDLAPEEAAALQPYITRHRPTARMNAPRKAKPEELEDSDRP